MLLEEEWFSETLWADSAMRRRLSASDMRVCPRASIGEAWNFKGRCGNPENSGLWEGFWCIRKTLERENVLR